MRLRVSDTLNSRVRLGNSGMNWFKVYISLSMNIGLASVCSAIEESPVTKIDVLQTVSSFASLNPMSFPSASIAYYDNTWSPSGAIFYPGGAITSITRSVCDDFLGTETDAYSINRYFIGIVNNNPRTLTFRPKTRFWLDSGSNSPGTIFAGVSPVVTMTAYTGQVLAISTNIPTVQAGKKWFSVVFDKGSWDATSEELNNLGVYLFGPPHVGVSADNLFLTTNPGDYFVSNPAGSLFQFGGSPSASMLGRFETPGTVYLSGLIQLPSCSDPTGRVVTIQVREADSTPVITESVTVNAEGAFVFSTPFPNPTTEQPSIGLPRAFRILVKSPGWLAKDSAEIEIENGGAIQAVLVAGPAGDIDDNNSIDLGDFDLFAGCFGSEIGTSTYLSTADFDSSGTVDLGDFDLFAMGFGHEGDS